MRVYNGLRRKGRVMVYVNGHPLDRRLDLAEYSPDGFDWGSHRKETKQLALAILADYFGQVPDEPARNHHFGRDRQWFTGQQALAAHEAFACEVLEPISTDRWVMLDLDVKAWLAGEPITAIDTGWIRDQGAESEGVKGEGVTG